MLVIFNILKQFDMVRYAYFAFVIIFVEIALVKVDEKKKCRNIRQFVFKKRCNLVVHFFE